MDESIFVYDSIVRKVWAKKGSKPRVMTTGSHKKVLLSGSVALDGSTLFRSYESITSREFISYLNALKRKYEKYVLFYDGAPWHLFVGLRMWSQFLTPFVCNFLHFLYISIHLISVYDHERSLES